MNYHHIHHAFQSCHCRSGGYHSCPNAFIQPKFYICPSQLIHPMRCHRSSPIFYPCSCVPMKCSHFSTIDQSKKRKIESITSKSATYHITVRPLSMLSKDSTTHQQLRNKSEHENQNLDIETEHFPSVPCRKIISERNNRIHVSSTSFVFRTDDRKNLHIDKMLDKKSPLSNIIYSTESEKPIIKQQRSNENIFSTESNKTKIPTSYPTPLTDDLLFVQNHSFNKNLEDKSGKIESKDDSVIELSSNNEVSIQSDVIRTISNENLAKTGKSPNQISASARVPSKSPPDITKIKSNEIAPQRIRSLTSMMRERPKSITDIRRSKGSLGKARSTIDFGFLIDEVITSIDEKKTSSVDLD